jgi:hypothetical protein
MNNSLGKIYNLRKIAKILKKWIKIYTIILMSNNLMKVFQKNNNENEFCVNVNIILK